MRAVIQRVTRASVTVDTEIVGEIGSGLVVLLGVAADDSRNDADYLAQKIVALRVFDDIDRRMNISLTDSGGALLVVRSLLSTVMFDAVCVRHGVTRLRRKSLNRFMNTL
jgi:D-tyrosyl-tRNA(Tyr) deacylase